MKKPGVRAALAAAAAVAVASAGTAAAVVARSAAAPAATGITVHGRWDVKVLDRSGRVVRERRFENALLTTGQQILNDLLSRKKTAGTWMVAMGSNVAGQGAILFDAANGQPTSTPPAGASFNLAVTFPLLHGGGSKLHLKGTVVSGVTQTLQSVATILGECSPSVAPSACLGAAEGTSGQGFTGRALSPGIPVQQGQTISVDVALSFS